MSTPCSSAVLNASDRARRRLAPLAQPLNCISVIEDPYEAREVVRLDNSLKEMEPDLSFSIRCGESHIALRNDCDSQNTEKIFNIPLEKIKSLPVCDILRTGGRQLALRELTLPVSVFLNLTHAWWSLPKLEKLSIEVLHEPSWMIPASRFYSGPAGLVAPKLKGITFVLSAPHQDSDDPRTDEWITQPKGLKHLLKCIMSGPLPITFEGTGEFTDSRKRIWEQALDEFSWKADIPFRSCTSYIVWGKASL